jgi:UDP-N-acetylglucosamine 2-epimerase (non-hydrolysing)
MISRRYAVVVGARPNFVKAAALFSELSRYPGIELLLIHTGQHYDPMMSGVFFDQLHLPRPIAELHAGGEFHTERVGRMFSSLMNLFGTMPILDGMIVFGDVNSSLAGALAAAKRRLPIIHVEAGLRSHDRRMPEEINRVIIDHLAEKLFTSEEAGRENLIREGVPIDRIHEAGNLMVQSLELFKDRIHSSPAPFGHDLPSGRYIVATIHRQENVDSENILASIFSMLSKLCLRAPVVMPLHPGTGKKLSELGLTHLLDRLVITKPLGYFEFMALVLKSGGVITDSGGIQEETTHLGIPCCTIRDNTERPVTVTLGSNRLFPPAALDDAALDAMSSHLSRQDFQRGHIPLWDNGVAARILASL